MRRPALLTVVSAVAAVACVAAASLLGCAPEEIVVASLPPGDGGPPRPPPMRCTSSDECPPNAFCSKPSCGAVGGVCEGRPTFCGPEPAPVCGCDGMTFYNDCLRRVAGAPFAAPGECGVSGVPCAGPGGASCPPGASCARLLPPGAPCRDVPGTCWVMPPECPREPPPGDRWTSCGPPPPACVDTCDALRSGVPHVRVRACP
jgi:hypothetical protein